MEKSSKMDVDHLDIFSPTSSSPTLYLQRRALARQEVRSRSYTYGIQVSLFHEPVTITELGGYSPLPSLYFSPSHPQSTKEFQASLSVSQHARGRKRIVQWSSHREYAEVEASVVGIPFCLSGTQMWYGYQGKGSEGVATLSRELYIYDKAKLRNSLAILD